MTTGQPTDQEVPGSISCFAACLLSSTELFNSMYDSGKAPGPDKINPELIKKGWTHLGPQLVDLFNACLRHAVFPRIWKRGRVKYLLKPGDREKTDPGSYRPICLLPVVGKLFEGVLLRLLKPTLEMRSSEAQHGFREGRSTEDAITRLYTITRGRREIRDGDLRGHP